MVWPFNGISRPTNYGATQTNSAHGSEEEDDDDDGAFSYASFTLVGSVADSIAESISTAVRNSLVLPGSHCSLHDIGGTANIPDQTFNLIKNIVGCGVLALPSGVAAFANAPSAMIPATFYIIVMGAIFGYYFLLIGKICEMTWAVSFREAWEETIGENNSVWVTLCNMLKPALANMSYSMILADTFRALFETIGLPLSRTVSLWIITVTTLLPLCMLKNLKVLAPFSILGTVVFVAVAIIMGARYLDGTYADGGIFLEDLPDNLKPSFGNVGMKGMWSADILVLVCMLFEAYVSHYNAPRFWVELKDRSIPRFRAVVTYSFGASSLLYVLITAFGFSTFGANCDGYILNNYSTKDSLATFCRLAIAVAIICTYPMVFIGFRDGVLDLFEVPSDKHTSGNLNLVTIVLLTIVTVVASLVKDLGLVNAVGGGTLATVIVFVFPTIMYEHAIWRSPYQDLEENDQEVERPTRAQKREVTFSFALMRMGVVMGIIGVWMAIANERSKQ